MDVKAKLLSSLALGLALCLARPAIADTELTKADIPPGLSPELKAIAEDMLSKNGEVRCEAIGRFTKMGAGAAPLAAFLVHFLTDKDLSVACCVESTLAHSMRNHAAIRKAPGLVTNLIRASRSSESRVRADAATLLGQTRDSGACQRLLELLKDPEYSVRLAAIYALGKSGDRNAFSTLERLQRKASQEIECLTQEACAAEIAMANIAAAQKAADASERQTASTIFCQQIEFWHLQKMYVFNDLREGAIIGLGLLRERGAIRLLAPMLVNKLGEPLKVRERAAMSLAQIAGRDAAVLLKHVALDRDEHPSVRGAAAVGLADVTHGELDDTRIVEMIEQYLSESSYSEQLLAIVKHGKTDAVRRAAAIAYVERVSAEWVGDIAIVEALHLPPVDSQSNKVMLKIAKYGRRKAVRAAAQRYLSKDELESLRKEGLLVTPQEVSDEAKKH